MRTSAAGVSVYACVSAWVHESDDQLNQLLFVMASTPKPLQLCTMTFKQISFHLTSKPQPDCAFLIPRMFMQRRIWFYAPT